MDAEDAIELWCDNGVAEMRCMLEEGEVGGVGEVRGGAVE